MPYGALKLLSGLLYHVVRYGGGNANALRGTETCHGLTRLTLRKRGGNANALRGTETCTSFHLRRSWSVAETPMPYGALKLVPKITIVQIHQVAETPMPYGALKL